MFSDAEQPVVILVALLVCLIPTTIGALLSAIGIAGMDRSGAPQRARDERPRGRSCRGLRDAAAGQDRHHHVRQPPGRRVRPCERGQRAGAGRRRAALEPRRRDARRAGRSSCWRRRGTGIRERELVGATLVAVHRADPDERRRLRGPARAQGRRRLRCGGGSRNRAATFPDAASATPSTRSRRRGAPRSSSPRPASAEKERSTLPPARARRDLPQGHREAGHRGPLRRPAAHGHPHGDDHRRQPADRSGDRRRRPASTTSSPRRRPRTRCTSSARSSAAGGSSR